MRSSSRARSLTSFCSRVGFSKLDAEGTYFTRTIGICILSCDCGGRCPSKRKALRTWGSAMQSQRIENINAKCPWHSSSSRVSKRVTRAPAVLEVRGTSRHIVSEIVEVRRYRGEKMRGTHRALEVELPKSRLKSRSLSPLEGVRLSARKTRVDLDTIRAPIYRC